MIFVKKREIRFDKKFNSINFQKFDLIAFELLNSKTEKNKWAKILTKLSMMSC